MAQTKTLKDDPHAPEGSTGAFFEVLRSTERKEIGLHFPEMPGVLSMSADAALMLATTIAVAALETGASFARVSEALDGDPAVGAAYDQRRAALGAFAARGPSGKLDA